MFFIIDSLIVLGAILAHDVYHLSRYYVSVSPFYIKDRAAIT